MKNMNSSSNKRKQAARSMGGEMGRELFVVTVGCDAINTMRRWRRSRM